MLRIEHLSVAVKGKQILKDINLHIAPGEVHVLFGPNGTGKSTLLGAIMGFERYEILEGKIYFKGQDITEAPCHERAKLGIGMMIQRPPTIRGLTLRQMITICGATPEEVDKMAQWMGLSEFLDRSVNEGFSGGELKRSELLQLMAQKPDLLLLDEPESGVDVENIALVGRAANYI
ncbi:MAG: ATP-binding cassette domain-containing protein, partial [Phascolarctobacterium sp.]|nr:ATP-binding cassette domain-containing protein [Phascolarctobacterium sp.]